MRTGECCDFYGAPLRAPMLWEELANKYGLNEAHAKRAADVIQEGSRHDRVAKAYAALKEQISILVTNGESTALIREVVVMELYG